MILPWVYDFLPAENDRWKEGWGTLFTVFWAIW